MAENPRFGRLNTAWVIKRIPSVTMHKLSAAWHQSESYANQQRQLATIILEQVLPTLSVPVNMPSPTTWTVRHVVRPVHDTCVVLIGPAGQPFTAVMKIPHTQRTVIGLQRHSRALKLLHADARLDSWCTLIPTLLAEGVIDGQHYVIEQAMPGHNAQGLLNDPEVASRVQLSGAEAIRQFHKATASAITVEATVFERWVGVPLQVLSYWNESLPSSMRYNTAIRELSSQLRRSLSGLDLTASWTHGDLWCANLLTARDGSKITGIIDWEFAAADDLPQLDQVQFLIATRMDLRGGQLASTTVELLKGRSWLPHEQSILDSAQLPGDTVDVRTLLLLNWLRRVAVDLIKATGFRGELFWEARNVKPVLQNL